MIDRHMKCPSIHKECKHEGVLSLKAEELAKRQETVSMYSFSSGREREGERERMSLVHLASIGL